jgi:hypothetical protein
MDPREIWMHKRSEADCLCVSSEGILNPINSANHLGMKITHISPLKGRVVAIQLPWNNLNFITI